MRRARDLFDRVADFHALCEAARRAAKGKRTQPHVARFLMDLEPEALRLRWELLDGTWRPGAYRRLRDRGLLELHAAGAASYYTLGPRVGAADRGELPVDRRDLHMDRGELRVDGGGLPTDLRAAIAGLGPRQRKGKLRPVIARSAPCDSPANGLSGPG